jgi:hypothetical protein
MSIGKRIAEAVEKSSKGDPESVLISVSIAIDATASKLYGKSGRSSYKKFIHKNLRVPAPRGPGKAQTTREGML